MADTLPEFLLHWAERTPDATFVGEPDRDRTYTYGEVAGAVAHFRSRLRGLGVARGDRVAVLGDNSCEWVVAYLGAIAHGAIAVPLNTRHATGDLDRALDDFEPVAIVGDHRVGVRGVVGRGDHPRLGVARRRVAPDVPGVRPRPRRQARRRHGDGAVTEGRGATAGARELSPALDEA